MCVRMRVCVCVRAHVGGRRIPGEGSEGSGEQDLSMPSAEKSQASGSSVKTSVPAVSGRPMTIGHCGPLAR